MAGRGYNPYHPYHPYPPRWNMAITAEELNTFLAGQGVTLDPLVVNAIVELANNPDLAECMAANGYTDAAQVLLALYFAYLLSIASFSRYITSQTAPNGASRSFSKATLGEMWSSTLSAIRVFDPHNCLGEFLPQDPTVVKRYGARVGVACYGK